MTSATQPPCKRPVVLRPILSNSLPLSIMSFSALEQLLKIRFFTYHVQLRHPTFKLYSIRNICQVASYAKRKIDIIAAYMTLCPITSQSRFWGFFLLQFWPSCEVIIWDEDYLPGSMFYYSWILGGKNKGGLIIRIYFYIRSIIHWTLGIGSQPGSFETLANFRIICSEWYTIMPSPSLSFLLQIDGDHLSKVLQISVK